MSTLKCICRTNPAFLSSEHVARISDYLPDSRACVFLLLNILPAHRHVMYGFLCESVGK